MHQQCTISTLLSIQMHCNCSCNNHNNQIKSKKWIVIKLRLSFDIAILSHDPLFTSPRHVITSQYVLISTCTISNWSSTHHIHKSRFCLSCPNSYSLQFSIAATTEILILITNYSCIVGAKLPTASRSRTLQLFVSLRGRNICKKRMQTR